MQFSTEMVRDLARLLNESHLHEIALQTVGENQAPTRIVVRGTIPKIAPRRTPSPQAAAPTTTSSAPEIEYSNAMKTLDASENQAVQRVSIAIGAVAVGLFRPVAPLLQVGDDVKKGQVVGVVESLKIPNEVKAPAAGRIAELLAEDGQGVEYAQKLMTIEAEV